MPLSPGVALLLVDSGVPHQLIGGEYNERRSQCQAAAAALGVKALRDVTSAMVAASDKIRKELGWVSQFPHVHEIIESAWRWHKANPNGYTD